MGVIYLFYQPLKLLVMKIYKHLILVFLLIQHIDVNAKGEFLLKAGGSFGRGNVKSSGFLIPYASTSSKSSYGAQIAAVYQLNKIRIGLGLGYLQSAFIEEGIVLSTYSYGPFYPATKHYKYAHFTMPIYAAYDITAFKKISLIPRLGVDISYNMDGKSKVISDAPFLMSNGYRTAGGPYRKLSIWGNAGVDVEYSLSKQLGIFGGLTYRYMFTNFIDGSMSITNPVQHNYTYGIDLGVLMQLKRKQNKGEVAKQ